MSVRRITRFQPPPALVALLALVVLAAAVGTAVARRGSSRVASGRPPATTASTTTVPSGGSVPSTAPKVPPTTFPGSPPSPAQARVLRTIQDQVSQLRGLPWKAPLNIQVVSRQELARRIRILYARDARPDRMEADAAVLKLLRLIPPDLDYSKTLEDLLAEQVVGYYDPETKELTVGSMGGATLSAATKSVIAHEMLHALTDQHFDFGPALEALEEADRQEELAAYDALLEGDAVLFGELWARRYLTPSDLLGGLGSSSSFEVLARVPPFLQEALFFPYTDGREFVASRHGAGGFAAVDEIYRRPPTSTEQILHPELWVANQGWSPPRLADMAAATGCGRVRAGTVGEWQMAEMLGEEVEEEEALRAAAGWNGDSFDVVRCGGSLGMVVRWQTDPGVDSVPLAIALAKWVTGWSDSGRVPGPDGRFSGPGGSGRLTRDGNRVDLVIADSPATAERLIGALG